jgi:hypothetical protein
VSLVPCFLYGLFSSLHYINRYTLQSSQYPHHAHVLPRLPLSHRFFSSPHMHTCACLDFSWTFVTVTLTSSCTIIAIDCLTFLYLRMDMKRYDETQDNYTFSPPY